MKIDRIKFKSLLTLILTFSLININFSQSKKVIEFIEQYKQVAHWNINGKNVPILKWAQNDSIDYYISGTLKYLNDKNWSKFIKKVEKLSGLIINQTNDYNQAQIKIYFCSLPDYFKKENIKHGEFANPNFSNWNSRKYSNEYQLTATSFCIDPSKVNTRKYGKYQLQKSFLKALGILGTVEDDYSILNKIYTKKNHKFSKKDMRYIKMHYSELIKKGQNEIKITDYDYIEKLLKEKF